MECSICLSEISCGEKKTSLICGHTFHTGCIKNWFLKSENGCPMCRGPLHFRGMIRAKWIQEKESTDTEEPFENIFNEVIEEVERASEIVGPLTARQSRNMIRWLGDAQNTCNILQEDGYDGEDIIDAIIDGYYLSPRSKIEYYDEPIKQKFHHKNRRIARGGYMKPWTPVRR